MFWKANPNTTSSTKDKQDATTTNSRMKTSDLEAFKVISNSHSIHSPHFAFGFAENYNKVWIPHNMPCHTSDLINTLIQFKFNSVPIFINISFLLFFTGKKANPNSSRSQIERWQNLHKTLQHTLFCSEETQSEQNQNSSLPGTERHR